MCASELASHSSLDILAVRPIVLSFLDISDSDLTTDNAGSISDTASAVDTSSSSSNVVAEASNQRPSLRQKLSTPSLPMLV